MLRSLRKWLLLALGIPFVMIGMRLILDAGQTALTHQAATSWQAGEARILSVERFSGADQAIGSQTVVRYQYTANGRDYEGSYSCVGEECPRADLYEVLQRLHDGNHPVDVLVDPDRPERSLLYRHLHMPLFLMRSGVGLFCFLTGGASVVFGVYLLCGPGRKEL